MTGSSHPYANTRAARLLAEGLQLHTSEHPGGLRAVAADLGMKQATVLSHMAHGRIGIPLDRATEFASKLGMDTTTFCLAVIEQRAPDVYDALGAGLLGEVRELPQELLEVLRAKASLGAVTEEHIKVIADVLAAKHPAEKWMRPLESDVIQVIRDRYPEGMTLTESLEMIEWIEAGFDEA